MKQSRKKPKLGQHFLKDENVKKRILDTVKNLKVKNIIESAEVSQILVWEQGFVVEGLFKA